MTLKTVRRLAADLLKCGETRIKILDPAKAEEALTREDVYVLIKQGAIKRIQKKGVGRNKATFKASRIKSGRRRGIGSERGQKNAGGTSKKRLWINKVRSQRKLLRQLLDTGALKKEFYRKLYLMVKGDFFKNKKTMVSYLKEKKFLTKE